LQFTAFRPYVIDPGCGEVQGVGLRSLACWDCGFESRRGARMSVSYECCILWGRGIWNGPISRPEELYRVYMCHWVWWAAPITIYT